MKKITIIDYGVGNLLSLKMALEHLGAEAVITRDKKAITNSSHLLLPAAPSRGSLLKKLSLSFSCCLKAHHAYRALISRGLTQDLSNT